MLGQTEARTLMLQKIQGQRKASVSTPHSTAPLPLPSPKTASLYSAYLVWQGNGGGFRAADSFPVEVALLVCMVLSLFVHYGQDFVIEEVWLVLSRHAPCLSVLGLPALTILRKGLNVYVCP